MAYAEKITNECLLNESFIPQWESHLGGMVEKARCPQSLCEMLHWSMEDQPSWMVAPHLGLHVECGGTQVEGPAIQLGQECPQRQTETSKIETESMTSPSGVKRVDRTKPFCLLSLALHMLDGRPGIPVSTTAYLSGLSL
jgi:hypothetical protein